ncbi:MAG: helix-turn-helix transcriptional regulator [Cyclobacteriaceae bacterium]
MRSTIAKRILDNTPEKTRHFVRKQADLVVRINELLRAKGYTQKRLAEAMGKKPSEINRWLKGEHNFTFKSICHLEAVLGESIFEVPKRRVFTASKGVFFEVTVYKNKVKPANHKFEDWKQDSFKREQFLEYGE